MEPTDIFDLLKNQAEKAILNALSSDGIAEREIKAVTESVVVESSQRLSSMLKENSPEMLANERKLNKGFVERCYCRWKTPIDLLKVIMTVCRELSECHAHNGPRSIDLTVFDALAHLQPKALLIASEILWLLEGGYADAALARWRTLHEVVVTAMFIAKNGPETARDYRYSEVFASQRDASEVNSHAKRANLQRFTEVEMNKMDSDCKVAEASIGRKLTNDFDWASPALKRSGETERATFKNIEKSVGMDHWRPRYRRACQHIHAGFTHPQSLLGMAEAKKMMFQVGPSNSGFVDPLHMTSISLHQITSTFLLFGDPDIGRIVCSKVIGHLVDELGTLSVAVAKETPEVPDQKES